MIGKMLILAIVLDSLGLAASETTLMYGTAYSGAHGATTLYSISPSTGAATKVGAIGFDQVGALAFAPNGSLYGVGQNGAGKWALLKVDLISGAGTAVGATGLDTPFRDIAFRSDGTLFGYASSQKTKSGLVYSLSTSTGAATIVGNITGGVGDGAAVAFSSENVLYTVNEQGLRTISSQNAGSVTALHYRSPVGNASARANAVKFDVNSGTLWALMGNNGAANNTYLANIDVKTGNVAAVGQTGTELRSIAVQPHLINPPGPLPSSLLFLITGALALLGWNRWGRSSRRLLRN